MHILYMYVHAYARIMQCTHMYSIFSILQKCMNVYIRIKGLEVSNCTLRIIVCIVPPAKNVYMYTIYKFDHQFDLLIISIGNF